MIRRTLLVVTAFLCGAVALSQEAPKKPAAASGFWKEAASSVEERVDASGVWTGKTTTSRFDFVSLEAGGASGRRLLSQRFVREERSDREGSDARLEVTALRSGAKPYDTAAWTFRTTADTGTISWWGDFYETAKRGCCGAEDLDRLFDLRTGREVAAFSGRPAFLAGSDSGFDRVVSYLGMMAWHQDVTFPAGRDVLGVLSLAARDRVESRVVIATSKPEDTGTPKVLVAGPGEPTGSDFVRLAGSGKGRAPRDVVDGIRVLLDYGDGRVVTIPIAHDAFDAAHASLPKGIALRPAATEPAR